MKAWKSTGDWFHKKSGITHKLEYIVLCNDLEDPIEAIKKFHNQSGHYEGEITYLRGVVISIDSPTVIPTARHFLRKGKI